MLFKRIVSSGLAHHSYIIEDGGEMVVIDPRRDIDIYLREAQKTNSVITHVLETHRNEDYVVGSVALAEATDAAIWHADAELDYTYGEAASEGQTWQVGRFELEALHTPGHTLGSFCYWLRDSSAIPWIIFTGDTLFADDVGRTDLIDPKRTGEMTALLYESLFEKLFPLGDHVIVCPAHGAGSVCGSQISDRPWTTLGMERLHNPKLSHRERQDFVQNAAVVHERPPYFRRMEEWNLGTAPPLQDLRDPEPLTPAAFAEQSEDALIVDTRSALAFATSHLPNAIAIPRAALSGFAGWFLSYDRPILLISENQKAMVDTTMLRRMGFDNVKSYLAGNMPAWHKAGRPSKRTNVVSVQELCSQLDNGFDAWILDVRSQREVESAQIPGAHHIHLTQLPQQWSQVPNDKPVHVFCGSGARATIAASLLQRAGFENAIVVLGGLAGWQSRTCPIES